MKIWGTNKIPQKYRDFRASTWIEKLVLKSCSYGNFGHLMQSDNDYDVYMLHVYLYEFICITYKIII